MRNFIKLAALAFPIVITSPVLAKEFIFPQGTCTFPTIKEQSQCGSVSIKHAGRRNGVMAYNLGYVAGDCVNGKITNVVYKAKKFSIKGKTITVDRRLRVKILSWNPKTKKVSISATYTPENGKTKSGGGSTVCSALK